jgi:putative N6-adenine-specific DNA methylase
MDFFDFDPTELRLPPGVLMLNPPYGRRLENDGMDFHERLGSHLRRSFNSWRFAVLVPRPEAVARLGVRSVRYWRVNHGGMSIVAAIGRI